MPVVNAADSMIRAYQTGLMERRAEEDQAAEQERKKIEMDLLKHRIQQMKLEERIKAWDMNVKGAEAQAKSFEGLPEAQMAQEGMLQGTPATDLSQVVAGMMPAAPGQMTGQPVAPATPPPAALSAVQANQPLAPRPIMAPGFQDAAAGINVPSIALRPKSREQLEADARSAAALKAETEGTTLSYGQKRYVGGKLVAEGGVDPMDAETARHNKEMERIQRMDTANKAAESKGAITAAIRQRAAEVLYNNLITAETAFAPDPKVQADYEETVQMWEMSDPKTRGAAPTPPKTRMPVAQLQARKLSAINAYRASLQLPKLSAVPPDWTFEGEVVANEAAAGIPAPAGAAAPVAAAPAPTPSPATGPVTITTPQGIPITFPSYQEAAGFAKEANLPVPPPPAAGAPAPVFAPGAPPAAIAAPGAAPAVTGAPMSVMDKIRAYAQSYSGYDPNNPGEWTMAKQIASDILNPGGQVTWAERKSKKK